TNASTTGTRDKLNASIKKTESAIAFIEKLRQRALARAFKVISRFGVCIKDRHSGSGQLA
ncbi:MAG: hypothetical protein VX559_11145, partial [Pseudomonadota bacterium]|nr:hypothetical protein [Pseudomonadota bacterium]